MNRIPRYPRCDGLLRFIKLLRSALLLSRLQSRVDVCRPRDSRKDHKANLDGIEVEPDRATMREASYARQLVIVLAGFHSL